MSPEVSLIVFVKTNEWIYLTYKIFKFSYFQPDNYRKNNIAIAVQIRLVNKD